MKSLCSTLPSFQEARETRVLRQRRLTFLGLVGVTWLALLVAMVLVLGGGGLTWMEAAMALCFAFTLPWIVIGFWNSVIGLLLLKSSDHPLRSVCPFVERVSADDPVTSRTAVAMPIHNECPERVLARLRAVAKELEATGCGAAFDIFVLSDTQDPEIAAREEAGFALWRARHARPRQLHYRRRANNTGYKAGNLREFCENHAEEFDYMIVLDADSLMSGEAILRLVRTMQRNPGIGILQSLAVGLPSDSAFARIFQFGMRQGMRTYTYGSAWWQGDRGPYWGHNAIVRLRPFREYCVLPKLPGRPPLGGEVLSHDQVEAVLMRRAGYEVRVLPVEGGSYEENPPTLPDFVRRDLRWCQGNMQYFRLLGLPGIGALGRVQLGLAILMYLSAPFWIAFLLMSFAQGVLAALGAEVGSVGFWGELGAGAGLGLFVAMMGMTFAPRLMGLLDVMTSAAKRRAYGGTARALSGGLLEMVFSMLLAPVISLAQSIFIVSLFLGRRVVWNGQNRDGHVVAWGDALRGLWPQLLLGVGVAATFLAFMPSVLPWAAPLLLGLLLAVPIAVVTSSSRLGRWLAAHGVCGLPEEWDPPAEFDFLEDAPAASPEGADGLGFVPEEAAAAPLRAP